MHEVRFRWVRGHEGIEENERCDVLAQTAALGEELGIDEGYEQPVTEPSLFD
jgi:ribonuclease HI